MYCVSSEVPGEFWGTFGGHGVDLIRAPCAGLYDRLAIAGGDAPLSTTDGLLRTLVCHKRLLAMDSAAGFSGAERCECASTP